jgi:hypothetical protein
MILSIKERITLLGILPQKGGIIETITIKCLIKKIEFEPEEIEKYGIKEDEGTITWAQDFQKDIYFNVSELSLLKNIVSQLDLNRAVTLDNIDLCVKIRDYAG